MVCDNKWMLLASLCICEKMKSPLNVKVKSIIAC